MRRARLVRSWTRRRLDGRLVNTDGRHTRNHRENNGTPAVLKTTVTGFSLSTVACPLVALGRPKLSNFRSAMLCAALAAVPLAPPVALTPSRAPRLSNRTVLHFNHLAKCAGSEMIEVLQKCLPSGQLRVATERESTSSRDQQTGFVVGSIREPCSAFVSLWAFGVAGHGRLHAQLVDRGLAGRFYPADHDPSAELHGATFREWLAHPARGMFQQRFDDSFPEPWAVDCWVRVESLESDLRRCLHSFEAQGGGPVDWSKAEPGLAQLQRRREAQLVQTGHDRTPSDKCNAKDTKAACHNPSTHDSCGDYFNASAASAVFAEQPGIVNAFGFANCCDGGATSTNTPQFEFPEA